MDQKKKKTLFDIDIKKISDEVLQKKANDENVSLKDFSREVEKHEDLLKKITPPQSPGTSE